MSSKSNNTDPRDAKVQKIQVESISPNPHNPRRLFDEEPLAILRESIEKLGVLVPITVYRSESSDGKREERFVLLDGERRWRCARQIGLETIPAIIVERPSDTQNILTMFHIHNLREGWQLMPTALKLETLMKELGTRNERKLSELTKLSISQVRRCKILLSYPRKYQNLMLAPPDKRLKADFFIELQRIRRPARRDKLSPWKSRGDSKCIQLILEKYLKGTIRAVTEFRRLAEIYRASKQKSMMDKFNSELDRFLSIEDMKISDFRVEGATYAKETKEITRSAKRLLAQVKDIDFEAISSDEETVEILKSLVKIIEKKLEDALLIEAREELGDHA
jgi:ParB family chromosome partitioning protein